MIYLIFSLLREHIIYNFEFNSQLHWDCKIDTYMNRDHPIVNVIGGGVDLATIIWVVQWL